MSSPGTKHEFEKTYTYVCTLASLLVVPWLAWFAVCVGEGVFQRGRQKPHHVGSCTALVWDHGHFAEETALTECQC